jgi:hypothetical protein
MRVQAIDPFAFARKTEKFAIFRANRSVSTSWRRKRFAAKPISTAIDPAEYLSFLNAPFRLRLIQVSQVLNIQIGPECSSS